MSNHRKFMIAADGGGTKTEFLLFDSYGQIHNHMVLTGSNPNSVGFDKAVEVLGKGIEEMIPQDGELSGIFLGIAGCSDINNKNKICDHFSNKYRHTKILVEPDCYNIINSCIPSETYACVICGTGSLLCVKTKNEIKLMGGYGFLFDKALCGYTLGREAIYATLRAEDSIEKESRLTNLIQSHFGGKLRANFKKLYTSDNAGIANLARIVFEAYDFGDAAAVRIVDYSVKELSQLINNAVSHYDIEPDVVLSGGLTARSDILQKHLKKYCGDINFIISNVPQIFGAAVYCCSQFADLTDDFTQTLKSQLNIDC